MFMTVAPGMLLTLVTLAFNLVVCLACWGQPVYITNKILAVSGSFAFSTVVNFYLGLLLFGTLTVLSEWKQTRFLPTRRSCTYLPSHLHKFTYVPISWPLWSGRWSGSPSTTPAARRLWGRAKAKRKTDRTAVRLFLSLQILIAEPMEILILSKHMGKRKYLDEAVYPLIPDKLPQLYILPGVAHAVHLSLGLAGVAAGDLTEGGAFVDLMDDKGFDGFGVFTHDLDLIELGPC